MTKIDKQNISKRIPRGRTFQTRDEYLEDGKGKKNIKPNHPNPNDLYRRVVVIETNSNDESLVVKLGTKGRLELPEYGGGKSKYKPIVEIHDNEGNYIKPGNGKFKENSSKRDVSLKDVDKMTQDVFVNASPKTRAQNHEKLKELKKRIGCK